MYPPLATNPPAIGAARQQGVGLIEVLVAILVLSIGLLGMAALQTKALSTNNSAMGRSMAVMATYSILDAMRADRTNALAGDYNTTVTANSCPTSTATLADNQLIAWCTELDKGFVDPASTSGQINCTAAGNCTVTITYNDSHGGVGNSSQTMITKAMI